MFALIAENAGVIFTFLIVLWIAQFGMAYLQMKRFYARLKEVRRGGLTAVGLAGTKYSGRAYAVLTVDDAGEVVAAEQFSGWTVFARLRPVPAICGMSVADVLHKSSGLPVSKPLQDAFRNAARDIQESRAGTTEDKPEPYPEPA